MSPQPSPRYGWPATRQRGVTFLASATTRQRGVTFLASATTRQRGVTFLTSGTTRQRGVTFLASATTRQRGVTFLALLLAVALVSSVLASTATVWSQAQRREREKQLLWAGDQFRRALASYSRFGNGTYPRRLEELLEDTRARVVRRHLRQLYVDPMTRSTDWGLVRNPQGQIIGVHSRYHGVPLKSARFAPQYDAFEKAASYSEWKFLATKEIPTPEQLRLQQERAAAEKSAPSSALLRGIGEAADKPPASPPTTQSAGPAADKPAAVAPSLQSAAPVKPPAAAPSPQSAAAEKLPAAASSPQSATPISDNPPAAAQPSASARPMAIPRSAVIGGGSSPYASSPLTPLENVQSQYGPSGSTSTPAPAPAPAANGPGAASTAPAAQPPR